MEIHVKRSLNRTDMVISGLEGALAADDSLQMVVQNQIPFLVPMQYEEIDSRMRLVYDISSRLSLTEYLEGRRLSRRELTGLIRGIGACSKKLQEYLLDPKLLMLRPDCIFTNPQSAAGPRGQAAAMAEEGRDPAMDGKIGGFCFCYHPFYQGRQQDDLQALFERIIACIDYEDQELVRITYEMFSAVQDESVQWKDVEAILSKDRHSPEAVFRDFYSGNDPAQIDPALYIRADGQNLRKGDSSEWRRADDAQGRDRGKDRYQNLRKGDSPGWRRAENARGRAREDEDRRDSRSRDDADDGLDWAHFDAGPEESPKEGFLPKLRCYLKNHSFREVLTDIDDGLILQKIHDEDAGNEKNADGIRMRHHALEGVGDQAKEYIELVRFPFYIGKMQGKSDYILDRDTVSRNHLCICRDAQDQDCCLIIDQKSRNGTYLNGKRIRPLVKERVREGDHIRLADAEFVFH